MKCVILQPSYVPWRGYFHQIQKADVFVFYDDVQYDDRGWRNRNRIKTPEGPQWISIPVLGKGAQVNRTPIREIRIAWERPWARKHWERIRQCYGRAPFFERYAPLVQSFYERRDERLSEFTVDVTVALARELGSTCTRFLRSSDLGVSGARMDKLLGILERVGGTHYISGPSARAYIDEGRLAQAGITIEYMSYEYPEYPQLHGAYDPLVTILDLLFMTGPDASRYLWRAEPPPRIGAGG